jgi:hypothetical protein
MNNKNTQNELNICRVTEESQIDSILFSKKHTITMVIFCYDDPKIKLIMKRHIAETFKSCYFVMAIIDRPTEQKYNFVCNRGTYIKEIKTLPYVFFFYDLKPIAKIECAEPKVIIDTLEQLIELLNKNSTNNNNQTTNNIIPENLNLPENMQLHNPNHQMMTLAREYQVEKISEDKKLHELYELQKLSKLQKGSNKQNKINDDDSDDNTDDNNYEDSVSDDKKKHKSKKTSEKKKHNRKN